MRTNLIRVYLNKIFGQPASLLSYQQKLQRAVFLMLSASLLFGIMAMLVKYTAQYVSVWHIISIRSVVALLVLSPLVSKKKQIWGKRKGLLILRGVLGLLAIAFSFYALQHLTLVNASVLFQTSPIFIFIFSHIFLSEKAFPLEWLLLALAFIGIALVIKPNFGILTWPAIAGLIGALLAGLAHTVIRILSRTDSSYVVVFYYSFIALLGSTPMAFLVPVKRFDLILFLAIVAIGLTATLAQLLMTKSYSYVQARKVAVVKYISIPFAALWGFLFWKEIPDQWTITGSLLIIAALVPMEMMREKPVLKSRKKRSSTK